MIGFDIKLNGEHVCTAGVKQEGVLTAIVTWVKRAIPSSAANELTNPEYEEELTFDVGGLVQDLDSDDINVKWVDRVLQMGDEICIKVVQTSDVDRPMEREREDRDLVEQHERQYYEQLKQKYGE
eukprot:GHVU01132633.1.p1 GENE.GHVU01132633.1~~GHVU01132633.1.p1  ORF type:complete len:125 (-),score=23.29 GHVU01132633.1:53-427(-)